METTNENPLNHIFRNTVRQRLKTSKQTKRRRCKNSYCLLDNDFHRRFYKRYCASIVTATFFKKNMSRALFVFRTVENPPKCNNRLFDYRRENCITRWKQMCWNVWVINHSRKKLLKRFENTNCTGTATNNTPKRVFTAVCV